MRTGFWIQYAFCTEGTDQLTYINEGNARIIVNEGVFYNPKMKKLRDISVAFLIAAGAEGMHMLDSTSATGIRGIRYAKEAGIGEVLFLDINPLAYKNTRSNVLRNKIKARVLNKSIQEFAGSVGQRFDVIDLDPFGSPAPNLNDIMKLCKDSTILMVTATDTAVLCGAHEGACIKQYMSKPIHNYLCKEAGLRILIAYMIRSAAQFNLGMEILASISDMHYMRVFARLRYGASHALASIKGIGFGAYCTSCNFFESEAGISPQIDKKCKVCTGKLNAFGPLYLGKLKDINITGKMLKVAGGVGDKAEAQIKALHDELDVPFFYSIPKLTKQLGMSSVSHFNVMKRLADQDYKTSATQFDRDGIKTDAPLEKVLGAVKRENS